MPSTAEGQQARIAIDRGPHHVGIPMTIEVTVEGFRSDTAPSCTPPELPPGLILKSNGERPSSRSFSIQINGRVQRSENSYTFLYIALADIAGSFEIGPFSVEQGKEIAKTKPLTVRFNEVVLDPNMYVAIEVPSGPYYIGQRIPITVEWGYAGGLDELSYETLAIRSPMFDMFRFEDTPERTKNQLPLETSTGKIAVNADVTERIRNGRKFVVVSAQRRMHIDRTVFGTAIPVHATAQIVTRWQRDFFGGRSPAGYRPIRAEGNAIDIHVASVPLHDAPPGFAGAVGHGFSITAKADRSVVQVGDPITVTLIVRGDTDMNHVSLPLLTAQTTQPGVGIVPSQFRISDGSSVGTVIEEGRAKRFEITLRPQNTSISQIPPLLFSWFNPTTKSFETTQCDPIALQVTNAKLIGAEDVVIKAQNEHSRPIDKGEQGLKQSSKVIESSLEEQIHDLFGTDLSIHKNISSLLTDHAKKYGGFKVCVGIYTGSIILILLATWLRRRDQIDPRLVKTRKMARTQLLQIIHAKRLTKREAAGQIASALRILSPLTTEAVRNDMDRIVAQCDVLAYARNDNGESGIDADIYDRAIELARKIILETR